MNVFGIKKRKLTPFLGEKACALILAAPITETEYSRFRGWQLTDSKTILKK